MHTRQGVVSALVLALAGSLAVSCTSTPAAQRPDAGRMEALTGGEAVTAVLARTSGKRVLVYHSPRCDFCRSLLDSFAQALSELPAGAVVYTVDIDRNPGVREAMGIGPVPVTVFLDGSAEVRRWRVVRLPFMARRGLRQFFAD